MQDLHIHIRDGINNIYELQKFIDNAKKYDIDDLCFLEHSNRISDKHFGYLDDFNRIDEFNSTIEEIRKLNSGISIRSGIEIDYSTNLEFRQRTMDLINYGHFDIVIGSIHSYKFEDGINYFKYILDMLDNYPISIIGHIKLLDNYLDYKDIIGEVIKKAKSKNVSIELNTSDRSIWNDEQYEFMIDLINKYDVAITCGSDSHHENQIFHNYDILSKRLGMK